MRTIALPILFIFLAISVSAQAPQAFKYQAVARDNSGNVLANKSVSFRISILSGGETGTLVYSETHPGKTTNVFGLVDLEIGKGTPVTGTFYSVNWYSGTYFLKVELDPLGGTAFQVLGTSQLLSVPYALHAKNVELEADGDAANEIQILNLNGNQLSLSKGGGTVTLPSTGGGDGWGTQTAVTDATLSGNGTVTTPLKIASQSASSGQVLKWNGTTWQPKEDETGGLTLPYSGTADSPGSGFLVTNNGGNAIRGITSLSTGSAIYGNATSTSGTNYGVLGSSSSSSGYGVMGYAGATSGNPVAVYGEAVSGWGIFGKAPLVAIYGTATSLTGNSSGVRGWSSSTTGSGVNGIAVSTTGENYGVKGESSSILGKGVYGAVTASTGSTYGVYGWSGSTSGNGVYGMAESETGVTYGVTGRVNSADGFSGFFHGGKFHVNGNVGIGTENPTAMLDVRGQVRITGGSPAAGKVLTSDALGVASWQVAKGLQLPFSGTASSVNYAPLFEIKNSDQGPAIMGIGLSPGNSIGVQGHSLSLIGIGVIGYAETYSGVNYGVQGISNSSTGRGIYGHVSSLSGTNYGVYGYVRSPDGYSGYFDGPKFYISGNAGLGTTNPSAKLEVAGQVKITGGSPGVGRVLISDATGLGSWQSIAPWIHNGTDIYLFNGNLGLGTTNPTARLEVSATQGPNIIIRDSDGGAGRPGIQFTNNVIQYIGGDDGSEEIFGFYSGYGNNRSFAARLNIHGPASNNWGKYLSLTYDGNHGRISTDGGYIVLEPAGQRVGIGTDAPTQNLDVNGTFRVRGMTTGTSAGTVYRTADGTLITGASDARLKDNIMPLTNSLEKIMQLNGVTFTWKADSSGRLNIGFVAQDVEKIIPELVFTNENDGYKGIHYAEVTTVLVEALKEQQKIIKEIRTENDRLKAENSANSSLIRQISEENSHLNTRLEKVEALVGTLAGDSQVSLKKAP